MGAFGVVLFAHVRAIFPRHLGGRAITGINLVGIAGAMGVQWLMGAIIEGGRGADGAYDVLAYRPAFAVTAAIGLLALWAYAPLLRRRGRPPPHRRSFMVEKPLAHTVAEADEVIAAAETAGVVAASGGNTRFSPALAQGHARRRAATDRITTDRRPRRPCRTLAAIPRTSGSASRSAS
jgi:MFS family permease